MEICAAHDHERIAFSGASCPACEEVRNLLGQLDGLREEIREQETANHKLQAYINEREEEEE
jgi:queuine/archaeosine tRNA-ribosyltransferase